MLAAFLLGSAYLAAWSHLPARYRVEPYWGEGGVNWFGHGPGAYYLHAAGLLAVLCCLRFFVHRLACGPADACAWYALLLVSLLPGVWLLVVCDWDNEGVSAAANWVGSPVALLAVPTAFALGDAAAGFRLPAGWYAARCLLEVALVPVWCYVWILFGEFLLLGWVGP